MKRNVFSFGLIIIIAGLVISCLPVTERKTNPEYEEWERAELLRKVWDWDEDGINDLTGEPMSPPEPEPPSFVTEYTYPYWIIGCLVILNGFVAVVIGAAVPKA